MKSRFIEAYGWGAWRNDSWPTRDHVIPFKMFGLMMAMLEHVDAAIQFRDVRAVALGVALSFSDKKDQKVKRQTRKLVKKAFPLVQDEDDDDAEKEDC